MTEHADINLVAAVIYSTGVVNEPVHLNPGDVARGRRVRRLPPTAVCSAAAMYFGPDPNNGRLVYNLS